MNNFVILEFYNPIKNRSVHIRSGAIAGFDYDGANKVNVIYTPGGVFPVQETLEEIKAKLENLNNSPLGKGVTTNVNK